MDITKIETKTVSHGCLYQFPDGTITDGEYYSRDYGESWASYGVRLHNITGGDANTAIGFTSLTPSASRETAYRISSDGTITNLMSIPSCNTCPQPSSAGCWVSEMKFILPCETSNSIGKLVLFDFIAQTYTIIVDQSDTKSFLYVGILNSCRLFSLTSIDGHGSTIVYTYNNGITNQSTLPNSNSPVIGYFYTGTYICILTANHFYRSTDGVTWTATLLSSVYTNLSSSYYSAMRYVKNRFIDCVFLKYISDGFEFLYKINMSDIAKYDTKYPDEIVKYMFGISLPVQIGTEQIFLMYHSSSKPFIMYSSEGSSTLSSAKISESEFSTRDMVVLADGSVIETVKDGVTAKSYVKITNCTLPSSIAVYTDNGVKYLKKYNMVNPNAMNGYNHVHGIEDINATEILLFDNSIPPLDCNHGSFEIQNDRRFFY